MFPMHFRSLSALSARCVLIEAQWATTKQHSMCVPQTCVKVTDDTHVSESALPLIVQRRICTKV